ncbi:CsbD family protein [Ancylobacter sp. G4_0304]|uniref:CsbD family protein n=1 Tax=Ancylobacter sp. G4_0304 TaxID=3114289 RepID=UPI0039C63972
MAIGSLLVETLDGALRIIVGAAREVAGRVLNDGALMAGGRVEQISGQASLACARVRSVRSRIVPRA